MIILANGKYGSWAKVEACLGWPYTTLKQQHCENTILWKEWPKIRNNHPLPPPLCVNEQAYLHLVEQNQWDVKYIQYLS